MGWIPATEKPPPSRLGGLRPADGVILKRIRGLRLRRSTVVLFVLLLATALLHDLLAPTGRGFGARGAVAAIDSYRAHISPHLRGVVVCRFRPTCSAYGRES